MLNVSFVLGLTKHVVSLGLLSICLFILRENLTMEFLLASNYHRDLLASAS